MKTEKVALQSVKRGLEAARNALKIVKDDAELHNEIIKAMVAMEQAEAILISATKEP